MAMEFKTFSKNINRNIKNKRKKVRSCLELLTMREKIINTNKWNITMMKIQRTVMNISIEVL